MADDADLEMEQMAAIGATYAHSGGHDVMFMSACLLKLADGGWFPVVMGALIFSR
jgi:K+ transporter